MTAASVADTVLLSDLFTNISGGADGQASLTYKLNATEGATTGLFDVKTGESIVLHQNNGVIEGVTASGAVVFRVSLTGTDVKLEQFRAISHSDTSQADEPAHLTGSNLISVTATVTDNDGDKAASTVDLSGAISFKDDGPKVKLNAVSSTEENKLLLTGNNSQLTPTALVQTRDFSTVFTVDKNNALETSFGADGQGNLSVAAYALGLMGGVPSLASGLTSGSHAITLSQNASGEIVGTAVLGGVETDVFKVSVNASGVVTLTQYEAVDPASGSVHSVLSDGLIKLSATATIIDKDGDHATSTNYVDLGSNISFEARSLTVFNDINDNGALNAGVDNQSKTMTVELNTAGQRFDGLTALPDTFIGWADAAHKTIASVGNLSNLAQYEPFNLNINSTSTVTFTFRWNGGSYESVVGWYDVNNPEKGSVIWDNSLKDTNAVDPSTSAGYTVSITVPAGVQLGFFLLPDANGNNKFGYGDNVAENGTTIAVGDTLYFANGHAYFDAAHTNVVHTSEWFENSWHLDPTTTGIVNPAYFSHETASTINLDTDAAGNSLQHAFSGMFGSDQTTLWVGFEDTTYYAKEAGHSNNSDRDMNDVIFTVQIENQQIQVDPLAFDLGVEINANATDLISSAKVVWSMDSADQVSYTAVAGLSVSYNSTTHTYTVTSDNPAGASVADFNTLLDSFKLNIGHTGLNEDFTQVSHMTREATVTVTDSHGVDIGTQSASFPMDVRVVSHDLGVDNTFIGTSTGSDTFAWALNDSGTDTIQGFDNSAKSAGGDVLDLRDLLTTSATTASTLDAYLDFKHDGSGNTVIDVKPDGTTATQHIVLQGVDLGSGSDQTIIQDLLSKGKLITD